MDRGAWWAAVHRVTQRQTQLKRLSKHACIGEGNGNPLQYSCLENPRDRGARWAAIYGVAQSRARLKQCSSSKDIMWLPWWLSGKESTCHVGEVGSTPGSGRSPGGGTGNPLQCSCLENPMDRGAWRLQSTGPQRIECD